MAQPGGIPTIYTDVSNPTHDFFTFRFTCEECHVFFDSRPKRSVVEVANRFADFGVKALDGFGLWQKAAETGEKVLDSDQEKEKATALLKAWLEVQDQFRFCQSCHRTVCARCFNESLRVCIGPKCAPDLQADSALYAYQKQREAQHQKIEQQYAGNIAPAAAPVPAITGSPAAAIYASSGSHAGTGGSPTSGSSGTDLSDLRSPGHCLPYLSQNGHPWKVLSGLWHTPSSYR